MAIPDQITTRERDKFVEDPDGDVAVRVVVTAPIPFNPLTPNRAMVTDGIGAPTVSPTTDTEIALLTGLNANAQTQLDGKQPLDADLTALAALSTTGVVARTAANTYVPRTITGTAGQVTVANGGGVAGDPTVSLAITPQNNQIVAIDGSGALTVRSNVFNPKYFTEIYEEFLGDGNNSSHTYGWGVTNNGAGANSSPVAGTQTNNNGVVSLNTGTTATGRAAINLSNATARRFGGGQITWEAYVRIPTLPTAGVEAFSVFLGFGDIFTGAAITNGVYWYTDGTFTNWNFITVDGGTQTFTLGTTAATTAWVCLGFVINAAGTSVTRTINGTTVGSAITTNIPTAIGREVSPFFKITKSVGTTTRALEVDYCHIHTVLTTART